MLFLGHDICYAYCNMFINSHPHKLARKKKRPSPVIDRFIYIAVIGSPVMTLPQVYSIWVEHQKGVSILSWTAYVGTGLIWLIYGIKHREWPIIILQLAWIVIDIAIIAGLLLT